MKYILGQKKEMTQIFDQDGRVLPVTVIAAGPVRVLEVKNVAKDGYDGVYVGYGQKPLAKMSKALQGQIKKNWPAAENGFQVLKEFRTKAKAVEAEPGQEVSVSVFNSGDEVEISGLTKGKGFQGVVKRYNFAGGPRTHGQKHSEREPGSIGATGPQKVFKGTKMAGRMGGKRKTVKGLRVVQVDEGNNLLYISGAVPGRRGSIVEIKAN
ncbi:MAG: 50S ribosomal protein L3 [Patescibacteria group bacterium]